MSRLKIHDGLLWKTIITRINDYEGYERFREFGLGVQQWDEVKQDFVWFPAINKHDFIIKYLGTTLGDQWGKA